MGEEEGSSEPITIKVKDASGEEMQFKVKKTTRMEKIFEAYAGKGLVRSPCGHITSSNYFTGLFMFIGRKGIAASSLRFMLDGTKITGEHTPKMLEASKDCYFMNLNPCFHSLNLTLVNMIHM